MQIGPRHLTLHEHAVGCGVDGAQTVGADIALRGAGQQAVGVLNAALMCVGVGVAVVNPLSAQVTCRLETDTRRNAVTGIDVNQLKTQARQTQGCLSAEC